MIDVWDFEDIRPYHDEEVPQIMAELCESENFVQLLNYIFSGKDWPFSLEQIKSISTIEEFQLTLIKKVVNVILDRSAKGLTNSGTENLSKKDHHLFISNHRDIILDPSIVNVGLHYNGFDTHQIAIGDNLLASDTITKLVRLNKSFIVNRNTSPREMLFLSKRLSNYIKNSITKEKSSVWIAQREGRSKDGNDQTQQGLLKMLNMSSDGDLIEHFKKLKIVPVSLSYEYDACDTLKTLELYIKAKEGKYEKSEGEDLNSMIKGLENQKGRIHVHYSKPLNEELYKLKEAENVNDQLTLLAEIIDKNIYEGYKLWPSNYIALDILREQNVNNEMYTQKEKVIFLNYMEEQIKSLPVDNKEIRSIFLKIYANPASNQQKSH